MTRETQLVGILNLTPDSFSDGGILYGEKGLRTDLLLEKAGAMLEEGATVLDLGGESSRPDSKEVSVEEELSRVIPALKVLKNTFPQAIFSVDTWKSEVAEAALVEGVHWINDITAGRGDEQIGSVVARFAATMVLMYSKDAHARTRRESIQYEDVVQTVKEFLRSRMTWAQQKGIQKIIIDPGMGAFVSSDPKYSFELIERIEEFYELACPILLGTSRKSFLGDDRLGATLETTLRLRGRVDYLRVHDVLENATVMC